jgi:hypothetical protein
LACSACGCTGALCEADTRRQWYRFRRRVSGPFYPREIAYNSGVGEKCYLFPGLSGASLDCMYFISEYPLVEIRSSQRSARYEWSHLAATPLCPLLGTFDSHSHPRYWSLCNNAVSSLKTSTQARLIVARSAQSEEPIIVANEVDYHCKPYAHIWLSPTRCSSGSYSSRICQDNQSAERSTH